MLLLLLLPVSSAMGTSCPKTELDACDADQRSSATSARSARSRA